MRSDAQIRAEKLRAILETGSTAGIHAKSLERFWTKGYLQQQGNAVTLTKRGAAVMRGAIGAAGRGAVDMESANRAANREGGSKAHAARARAMMGANAGRMTRKQAEAYDKARETPARTGSHTPENAALAKILGTYAVTIAPSDGGTLTPEHLQDFHQDGWRIAAASTAPARIGSRLPGARRETYDPDAPLWNPSDPLGPFHAARAIVLLSPAPLDIATLAGLQATGYDLSPAPPKHRKAPTRNPHGNKKETQGVGWEITGTKATGYVIWIDGKPVEEIGGVKVRRFKTISAARSVVKRFFDHYKKNPSPGAIAHGPHATATQRRAALNAEKKARAWFDNESLVTGAKVLKSFDFEKVIAGGFVEIGEILKLDYLSNKYNGKQTAYTHEITKKRRLFISADGSTLVIWPPLKVTSRGIMG
jgi:hypothetical protein